MNGWRVELWLKHPDGGLLESSYDPAEMVIHYREARSLYREKVLWLLLSKGQEVNTIDYKTLRMYVKRKGYTIP
jgi:hypothetical protein